MPKSLLKIFLSLGTSLIEVTPIPLVIFSLSHFMQKQPGKFEKGEKKGEKKKKPVVLFIGLSHFDEKHQTVTSCLGRVREEAGRL